MCYIRRMPNCGRVTDFEFRLTSRGFTAVATVQPMRMRDHFVELIGASLPRAVSVQPASDSPNICVSSDRCEDYEPARRCLALLNRSMTIEIDAVETHALALHKFADLGERTQLGDLVEQAKDYGAHNRSDPCAVAQLQRTTLDWLALNPITASLDAVAAIPSTQEKEIDLPASIVDAVSCQLGKPRLYLRSRNQNPQKAQKAQSASRDSRARSLSRLMNADRDAFGRRVLLIDDLYRSGSTMSAGASALRAAGATAVYCLALTKTARDCNGLPASADNWPDLPPDTFRDIDQPIPFDQ